MPILRRKTRRLIIAVMADSHGGSSVGLLNPETVFIEEDLESGEKVEYHPELNEVQRYLDQLRHDNMEQVVNIADGDEIVVFHNGDITHGTKYPEGLMKGITPSQQRTVGYWNMRPWYKIRNVKRVFLFTGTEAHDWMQGSSEVKIAYDLKNDFPHVDTRVKHLGLFNLGKETIDISHHGPGGGVREWTRGNVARYYLIDRVYKDRRMGRTPSRAYLRSHFHINVWEAYRTRFAGKRELYELLVVPSFSAVNWHARKVTRGDPELCNGMYALEVIDGRLAEIHDLSQDKDLRVEEVL